MNLHRFYDDGSWEPGDLVLGFANGTIPIVYENQKRISATKWLMRPAKTEFQLVRLGWQFNGITGQRTTTDYELTAVE